MTTFVMYCIEKNEKWDVLSEQKIEELLLPLHEPAEFQMEI